MPSGLATVERLSKGPVIGQFLGHGIPGWVATEDGCIYEFLGIAPGPQPGVVDTSKLVKDEIAIAPGLLFSLRK